MKSSEENLAKYIENIASLADETQRRQQVLPLLNAVDKLDREVEASREEVKELKMKIVVLEKALDKQAEFYISKLAEQVLKHKGLESL